jgi:phenylalanyl-tRNA synthetase beta chain
MRPIDVVVDITNYVMLEYGQPLHAYDAARLVGRALVARRARAGEHLRTLDGVDRVLRPADLVIADDERALGIAGILGGADSEISSGTTAVALECASFEPRAIRRTATQHGLHGSAGSAAARRFGLDLSPELVPVALARAVALLREHAGARVVGAVDVYPKRRARANVRMRFSDISRVLGADIPRDESLDSLHRLGFTYADDGEVLVVTPPAMRTDIAIAEDVVEEVARIVGYDRIPTRVPDGPLPLHERHPLEELRERARDALVGLGLQETISYALIDPAWLTRLSADGSPIAPEAIRVANPTSVAQSALRPTLRASLLDTARRNVKHTERVAIFEISPVYLARADDLPEERWTIGILLAGRAEEPRYLEAARDFDLHDLEGITSALWQALRLGGLEESTGGAPGLHPGRSGVRGRKGRADEVRGQLDPRVAALWELPASTFVAELDLHAMLELVQAVRAVAPPRYPAALRDLALVVDETVAYGDLVDEIRAAAKATLEAVELLDVYRGAQIGPGKKSFAVRLVLRSASGTLTEEDVEKALRRVEGRLAHRFGATPRG